MTPVIIIRLVGRSIRNQGGIDSRYALAFVFLWHKEIQNHFGTANREPAPALLKVPPATVAGHSRMANCPELDELAAPLKGYPARRIPGPGLFDIATTCNESFGQAGYSLNVLKNVIAH
ncbi:MAG: hypothetical protein MZV65_49060 [Chromatiales bacterium]|nr:hypothetical protein [Chromatiales bacterium]